ncbi:hypothetical protein NN3_57420 [Nocardia neocaledoniensis NBRC 108232]|uniref:Peptidase M48-like protein n=1 Tax=Nocardia neocaledoniensis TaxID=236511 RepID=A0A317NRL0_9NOCA|nr:M48 family metalloprotease [Nocardia neocaledoniensis]PWV77582.1 peptidase M48-like protein [Nocardia neocaledoniensis]GEM34735.1 hypothetical protein NN3_57420 [Nocardia neocaledoniensis NBRC 108232]
MRRLITRRDRCTVALGTIAVSLPSMVLSGWLLATVAGYPGRWVAVTVTALWLLCGVLVQWLGVLLATVARHGTPVDPESPAGRAWAEVARAAGIDASGFQVWISESDRVHGFATAGGHLVVTRAAVDALTGPQLAALLAHELGHQVLASHRLVLLTRWYRWPVDGLLSTSTWAIYLVLGLLRPDPVLTDARFRAGTLGFLVGSLTVFVPMVAAFACWVALVGAGLVFLLGVPGAACAALLLIAQEFARPALSRWVESRADDTAVDLGYGRAFLGVLIQLAHQDQEVEPTLQLSRRLGTHPTVDARMSRVHLREARRRRELTERTRPP